MGNERQKKLLALKKKLTGIYLAEIIVGVFLLIVFYAIVLLLLN